MPPIGFTEALIQANVSAPATIPAFAAPDPTPAMPSAVAMPTDEIGETIKAANASPKKIPIGKGERWVATATTLPIAFWMRIIQGKVAKPTPPPINNVIVGKKIILS